MSILNSILYGKKKHMVFCGVPSITDLYCPPKVRMAMRVFGERQPKEKGNCEHGVDSISGLPITQDMTGLSFDLANTCVLQGTSRYTNGPTRAPARAPPAPLVVYYRPH